MSRPIEQALNNLIPRHSSALPPALIDLANSLLAQSRNKCSNLKSEEELARIYICANLACERLKTSLNLPPIEPSPPIPPRAYKKLYAYFDRSLSTSFARKKASAAAASSSRDTPTTTPNTTPRKPKPNSTAIQNSSPNPTSRSLPQRHTPTKATSFSSFRTPKKGLLSRARTATSTADSQLPKWVQPTIRLLCADMHTPLAGPHILAGVESVLYLSPPPPSPSETNTIPDRPENKIGALIAAIWFFVVVKMRGRQGQGYETAARKREARESLMGACENEAVIKKVGRPREEGEDGNGDEVDEAWKGYEEEIHERDVNAWRKEIVGRRWRELDWFLNIEEGCGVERVDVDGLDDTDQGPQSGADNGYEGLNGDEDDELERNHGESNMIQAGKGRSEKKGPQILDRYDYLSLSKQRVYEDWRKEMLRRVNELLAEADSEAEDVDVDVDGEGDVAMV